MASPSQHYIEKYQSFRMKFPRLLILRCSTVIWDILISGKWCRWSLSGSFLFCFVFKVFQFKWKYVKYMRACQVSQTYDQHLFFQSTTTVIFNRSTPVSAVFDGIRSSFKSAKSGSYSLSAETSIIHSTYGETDIYSLIPDLFHCLGANTACAKREELWVIRVNYRWACIHTLLRSRQNSTQDSQLNIGQGRRVS